MKQIRIDAISNVLLLSVLALCTRNIDHGAQRFKSGVEEAKNR